MLKFCTEKMKRKGIIMTNKITIRAVKTAFYNGGLVYSGEIIKNYKGDKVPSWATLANGKEINQKEKTPENGKVKEVQDGKGEVQDDNGVQETAVENIKTEEKAEQTQEAITAEYNALLDEAVEKNIIIEDADKKQYKNKLRN